MKLSAAQSTAAETLLGEPTQIEVSGTVFDIQRFSVHDGPGIRTVVFLKGCPLRCRWCSNPESQRGAPEILYTAARCLRCGRCVEECPEQVLVLGDAGVLVDRPRCTLCGRCVAACPGRALRIAGRVMSVDEVLAEVQRDGIFYRHSGGGMTLSGGEPLWQPDFALALLMGARAIGIHTAIETTGQASPYDVRRVLAATNLILYDVKHMDARKHQEWTGASNSNILQNAELASRLGVPMIIRTPVVPGFNDDAEEIVAIGRFALRLGCKEMHLLPYHSYGAGKYASLGRVYELADVTAPSAERMQVLREALRSLGLDVRVGG